MIIRTDSLIQYQHLQFEFEIDANQLPETDITFLKALLEQMVASGSVFGPDQLLQIGWSICRVVDRGNALGLQEPDFLTFPVRWVSGVSNTLLQLRWQTAVAESISMENAQLYPTIRQSAVVCSRLGSKPGLLMERAVMPCDGNDSQWTILCLDSDHDHGAPTNLSRKSLYEIAILNRIVAQYASLPPESLVIHDHRAGPQLYFQGRALEIRTHSFLAEKYYGQ